MVEANSPTPDEVSEFMSSDRRAALIENTARYLEMHPDPHHADFLRSFAGRVFEELGYLWCRKRLGHKQRLLDPDETLAYFLDLYGGLPSQTLLQGGVFNEYLPDGIILPGEGNPLASDAVVVEYTASSPNARLSKYIHHKEEMVRTLRKRFPPIFGHGKLQIIFTVDSYPTVKNTKNVDARTSLFAAPHSHGNVYSLTQTLIEQHFPHIRP